MRFLTLFLVFLLVATTTTFATQELNPESFAQLTTSSGKNGMIKFFQSWCGHCTAMKPAWDELADTVDSSVFVADVNCGDQEELCEQVGVSGYPTIKVYKDGEVSDYQGGRSVEDLLEYVDSELAVKCNVNNMKESNCSEKAVKYVEKWTAKKKEENGASVMEKEMARLQGMAGKSMTPELKAWLRERLNILTQLTADASASAEEL